MNTVEDRIRAALIAKADAVTDGATDALSTGHSTGADGPVATGQVLRLQVVAGSDRPRRRRAAVLAAAAVAAVLAIAVGITVSGRGDSPQPTPAFNRSQVPWSQVGNGWTLVTLQTRKNSQTLYLVDPSGQHYAITDLPLTDWLGLSGWERDPARAILSAVTTTASGPRAKTIVIVDLHTGTRTELSGAKLNYQRFAGPGNHTIVNAAPLAAEAFSDDGKARLSYVGDAFHGSAVSPDGSQVAFGSDAGLTIYPVDSPQRLETLTQPTGYNSCTPAVWTTRLGLVGTCSAKTKSRSLNDFVFAPGHPATPVDPRLPTGWRAVRFTGGEIAFQHPDPLSQAPRDSSYARVLADGRLQKLTLPAALQANGWVIEATTDTDFLLTRTPDAGVEFAVKTDAARWNPLTDSFTVIQHASAGAPLAGYLAWNSYFDS